MVYINPKPRSTQTSWTVGYNCKSSLDPFTIINARQLVMAANLELQHWQSISCPLLWHRQSTAGSAVQFRVHLVKCHSVNEVANQLQSRCYILRTDLYDAYHRNQGSILARGCLVIETWGTHVCQSGLGDVLHIASREPPFSTTAEPAAPPVLVSLGDQDHRWFCQRQRNCLSFSRKGVHSLGDRWHICS